MEGIKFTSKLIGKTKINEETKILDFEVPQNFEFKAGQYVRLAFYKNGKRILRDYSISSSPLEKGKISIYFKKVEEGYASKVLFEMEIGEEIEMKGPYGDFVIKDTSKDLVFISSGTGFGPFMSMIKDSFNGGFNQEIFLIRGYKSEESLVYEEELKDFSGKNFKYYNILSSPKDENYKFKGHIQDFLEEIIPKNFEGDFYICGLKEMVFEVHKKLNEMGILDDKIFFEKYN